MGSVRRDEEQTFETKLEWHRPSVMVLHVEETTLGKLGSSFDGPGMPNEFSDD